MTKLDHNIHLEGEKLRKTLTGEIINLNEEPVFILRASDLCALPALRAYRQAYTDDIFSPYRIEKIVEILERFWGFKVDNEDKMRIL